MADYHLLRADPPHVFLTESYDMFEVDPLTAKLVARLEQGDGPSEAAAHAGVPVSLVTALEATLRGRATRVPEPPTVPRGMYLIVSQVCNLACAYCYADAGSYGATGSTMMSTQTARAAVDWLLSRNPNAEYIQFFGGEPFLNPEAVLAAVARAEELLRDGAIPRLPAFSMVSNLTAHLDERILDTMGRTRFSLIVSLDGPQPIHDALRRTRTGEGSWHRVMAGLEQLYGRGLRPSFEATYNAVHAARMGLWDVYEELASTFPYTTLFIKGAMLPRGHPLALPNHREHQVQVREVIAKLVRRMAGEHPIYAGELANLLELYRQRSVRGPNYYLCPDGAGTSQVAIRANGDIYACYAAVHHPGQRLGSVHDDSPTTVAENGRRFQAFNKDRSPCRECWARHMCSLCLAGESVRGEVRYGEVRPDYCEDRLALLDVFLTEMVRVQRDLEASRRFNANLARWYQRGAPAASELRSWRAAIRT